MRRSMYGLWLLLALLIVGIFTTGYMQRCHSGVAQALELAAEEARTGMWDRAQAQLQLAKDSWNSKWGITAALSDHEPMEKMNDLLAQLEVFLQARDTVRFRAVCARAQEALDALGEAHSIAWWNVA